MRNTPVGSGLLFEHRDNVANCALAVTRASGVGIEPPVDGGTGAGDAPHPWTRVTGVYVKGRLVVRLLFGSPARIDWPRGKREGAPGDVTHYWFSPGRLFAVLWWARLSPRRQVAGFAVAESLPAAACGHLLPGVAPAVRVHAFLLTRCVGRDRRVVDRAEALVRRIERDGIEPESVPVSYYRAAGQSLRVGREPRRLGREAFLRFQRSTSHAS